MFHKTIILLDLSPGDKLWPRSVQRTWVSWGSLLTTWCCINFLAYSAFNRTHCSRGHTKNTAAGLVRYCAYLVSWGSTHFSWRKNMNVSKFRQKFSGCIRVSKVAHNNLRSAETWHFEKKLLFFWGGNNIQIIRFWHVLIHHLIHKSLQFDPTMKQIKITIHTPRSMPKTAISFSDWSVVPTLFSKRVVHSVDLILI